MREMLMFSFKKKSYVSHTSSDGIWSQGCRWLLHTCKRKLENYPNIIVRQHHGDCI